MNLLFHWQIKTKSLVSSWLLISDVQLALCAKTVLERSSFDILLGRPSPIITKSM